MSKEFNDFVEQEWNKYQETIPNWMKKQYLRNPVSKASAKLGIGIGCAILMYPKKAASVATAIAGVAISGAIIYAINKED